MSKYIKLEDAIEQVKTEFYGGGYQEWLEISIDNLINRIADLPTIEVSEDCISREFALEVADDYVKYPTRYDKYCAIKNAPSVVPTTEPLMHHYNNELPPQQGWICPKCGRVNAPCMPTCGCVSSQTSGIPYLVEISSISRDSHEMPTTEQSSMVGEWTNAGILTVHCSNCKSQFHELEAMNYCPNCGARMKGAEE